MIRNLESLLEGGEDSAQLRFALASRYAADGSAERALKHVEVAVELSPDYSAAWRLLGQVRSLLGDTEAAISAFENGIEVAKSGGDMQLVREMDVFLRRLIGKRNDKDKPAS